MPLHFYERRDRRTMSYAVFFPNRGRVTKKYKIVVSAFYFLKLAIFLKSSFSSL